MAWPKIFSQWHLLSIANQCVRIAIVPLKFIPLLVHWFPRTENQWTSSELFYRCTRGSITVCPCYDVIKMTDKKTKTKHKVFMLIREFWHNQSLSTKPDCEVRLAEILLLIVTKRRDDSREIFYEPSTLFLTFLVWKERKKNKNCEDRFS